jgi:hypothetical protein
MAQADIDLFLFQARGKQASQMGPAILAANRLSMVDMLRAFDQLGPTERDEFRKAAFDGIPAQGCGFSSTVREARQVARKSVQEQHRRLGSLTCRDKGQLSAAGEAKSVTGRRAHIYLLKSLRAFP